MIKNYDKRNDVCGKGRVTTETDAVRDRGMGLSANCIVPVGMTVVNERRNCEKRLGRVYRLCICQYDKAWFVSLFLLPYLSSGVQPFGTVVFTNRSHANGVRCCATKMNYADAYICRGRQARRHANA